MIDEYAKKRDLVLCLQAPHMLALLSLHFDLPFPLGDTLQSKVTARHSEAIMKWGKRALICARSEGCLELMW